MSTYDWQLHPHAEALVDRLVTEATGKSPELAAFADRLAGQTATRLQDWLDTVAGPVTEEELAAVGYRLVEQTGLWRHPGAQLPAVLVAEHYELTLRVDDIAAAATSYARVTGPAPSPRCRARRCPATAGWCWPSRTACCWPPPNAARGRPASSRRPSPPSRPGPPPRPGSCWPNGPAR